MSQETAPGIAGMTHQESLYGKTPDQLAALCGELGMPRFAARQIARWLYVRHTEDPLRAYCWKGSGCRGFRLWHPE